MPNCGSPATKEAAARSPARRPVCLRSLAPINRSRSYNMACGPGTTDREPKRVRRKGSLNVRARVQTASYNCCLPAYQRARRQAPGTLTRCFRQARAPSGISPAASTSAKDIRR